jgi:serine/threonine-protein kinase
MPLAAGTRVGSYEVVAAIGEGGMGQVYRARDTRLGRDVALKIVSGSFGADPGRLARFEREAKTLASLNHPHIAQLYGIEDLDAAGGGVALVLELVEGEDLSARMGRGPVSADSAAAMARQIADALDAAHERGIVHRDLKPANIKVRADGTVKVLDFGLAKDSLGADSTNARTVTALAAITEHHAVVGTPAYMSPEQATGQPVDHRTDIWAFGCVLYEMLSGRQPFKSGSSIETLAAVITADPDWTAIASAPPSLQALVRRCLQKDVRPRVHHIADVRMWLDESAGTSRPTATTASSVSRRRRLWPVLVPAVVVAATAGGIVARAVLRGRAGGPLNVVRFEITPPASQPFTGRPSGANIAISPDGSTIVYNAIVGDTFQLVRRKLDDVVATPVAGTERAQNVAFSPDGQHLAFYSGAAIRTVPIGGGTPAVVCELDGMVPFLAWLDTGDIVFSQKIKGRGLMRVPAKGGTPAFLLDPDPARGEMDFFGLIALPGGRIGTGVIPPPGERWRRRLAILVPGASELKSVMEDISLARYAAGQLIYRKDAVLSSAPFSLDRLEFTGDARVLETVKSMNQLFVASNGTYVYLSTDSSATTRVPAALLRADGRPERIVVNDTAMGRHVRISPDGGRAAVTTAGLNFGEIWVYDLRGSAQPVKLTFRPAANYPVWTPDGRGIVFQSTAPGPSGLFSVAADGSVTEPKTLLAGVDAIPEDWSPNGSALLYQTTTAKTGADLFAFDRASGASRPWLQTPFNEAEARFSPDGTLVAYMSDQSGRSEIWLRPFGAGDAAVRVSSEGGHEPHWSADGRQLFFQSAGRMAAAVIERSPGLRPLTPRAVFEGGFVPYNTTWRRTYGVMPDGRFLVLQLLPAPRQSFVVVMHALDR